MHKAESPGRVSDDKQTAVNKDQLKVLRRGFFFLYKCCNHGRTVSVSLPEAHSYCPDAHTLTQ